MKASGGLPVDDPLYAPGLKLRPRSDGRPPRRIWLANTTAKRSGFHRFYVPFSDDMAEEAVAAKCRDLTEEMRAWCEGNCPHPRMFSRVHRKKRELPDVLNYAGSGLVYFIQCDGADRRIKIGFTTDLRERMSALVTGCPYPIKLLGAYPAPVEMEAWLHQQFPAARQWGEWFAPTPRIMEWATDFEVMAKQAVNGFSRTNVPFLRAV